MGGNVASFPSFLTHPPSIQYGQTKRSRSRKFKEISFYFGTNLLPIYFTNLYVLKLLKKLCHLSQFVKTSTNEEHVITDSSTIGYQSPRPNRLPGPMYTGKNTSFSRDE